MKATIRTTLILMLTIMLSVTGMPVFAEEPAAGAAVTESAASDTEQIDYSSSEEEAADDTEQLRSVPLANSPSETVTGAFDKVSGKDVATIRYYVNEERTEYAFAEVNETGSKYEYSFAAPYDGFTPVAAASDDDAASDANIIAEYYSTTKWDGAVDVSWYDETSSSFEIGEPAQLAGLAAVVNGSINNSTPIYRVKGERSDLSKTFDYDTPQTSKHQDMNEGLPDCIENKYYEKTSLIAGVQDEAYEGLSKHDFANRTIYIASDLDMGGADASEINHAQNAGAEANTYDGIYPNWTPIGGEYLMDPSDGTTMIKAAFNGSIDGRGHSISKLYCFRWSYRTVGDTAYGYAQGTGLIGMMGSLYDGESQPSVIPSVKNMSLSGYIYGRRMVGGFVGCMGGGVNAASGTSLECGIHMENLANHAEIHCTDSKGLGGIVACSMIDKGSIINCYNTGYLDANYAAPTGGIIGSNEGMSIYCCYNTGTVYTHGNSRGRGIGCDGGGSDYTVDNCYYLEGCGDDDKYPGYYTYNLAKSVSINTEALTDREITDGTLLQKLNVNGTAYVEGDGGYPVLYWEKNSSPGTGELTIQNNESEGTVTASQAVTVDNGTVVYLNGTPQTGFKCRYFTNNGTKLSGNYVTVNGSCNVSGFFEEVKPGTIRINSSDVCSVSITKNGVIYDGGVVNKVTDYPVKSGDSVYEGDVLMLQMSFNDGSVPEDEDLIYQAAAPDFFSNPYEFTYSYEDENGESEATETTAQETFTVSDDINGEEITLVLDVRALTSQKMWDYIADTGWYSDSKSNFTLTTARQLAGLSVLVDEGKNFAGKTVTLGRDISLANSDGTSGKRFWDGIGSEQGAKGFAGTFDGAGHKITDYSGSKNGLFEYCEGSSDAEKAVIKDLELWGHSEGQNACGIAMKAKNTDISGCVSYCTVKGTTSSGHIASILGYAYGNCSVTDCINYAEIRGKGYVGGIAGELNVTSSVDGCINKGNIFCLDTGGNNVGGLTGSLNGQVYRSANYGNIRAYGRNIGGVAGQSVSAKAVIDSCCNVGRVTYLKGTNSYDSLGGIIGFASIFIVKNSFNYGAVEKLSGSMPSGNIGGIFGREAKNSKSLSDNDYYLDNACEYAEAGTTPEDLDPEASYCKGIHAASAAEFALPEGILANITEDSDDPAFILANGMYPELSSVSGTHVHSGGTATCSTLAECDECGLSYGLFSDSHIGTRVVGASDAVWLTDGYSGDILCKGCGEVISEGQVITADPKRPAVSFIVRKSDNSASIRTYTVAQFDALKTTESAIGYSYGSKSSEITAATQYVTLDSILDDLGVNSGDVSSIIVECTGSRSTIDAATLAECSKYFEGDEEYAAPAAFMIAWNTGKGTLEEISAEASVGGTIRFGYGISEEQKTRPVGGARLVSPVEVVTVNVGEAPTAASLSNAGITVADEIYTGTAVTPAPEVKLDGSLLAEGADYELIYTNNINVGTAKIIVVGKGDYTGSCSKSFLIKGLSIENAEVTVDGNDTVYSGTAKTPAVQVSLNGKTLTEGVDYNLKYENNTDVGTASVTVNGTGNYEGTITAEFTIDQKSMSNAMIYASDMTYNGAELTPEVLVVLSGKVLKQGADYEIQCSDNISAGTGRITVRGKGNYKDNVTGTFTIAKRSIAEASVSGLTDMIYTGKALTQKPSVALNAVLLKAGTDYKVSYSNNIKVGTAVVTVTGTGNSEGEVTRSFRIVPKKAAVSKPTLKKGRKLTIKMKTAVSKTGGTKYAVQYRVKGKTKWTTKYTTKQSITLKKLKKGKKYQIRVRAVKGTSYGAWSAVKTSKKIKK